MPMRHGLTLGELGHWFTRRLRLGLSAVIERADGGHSSWALAHPGERPDFHDPAGFVLRIERTPPW
jgi:hypothetical protein